MSYQEEIKRMTKKLVSSFGVSDGFNVSISDQALDEFADNLLNLLLEMLEVKISDSINNHEDGSYHNKD